MSTAPDQYPTIISFFTNTWEYPKHATRLIKECQSLQLNYYIKELEDSGTWMSNTRMKAEFILTALMELKRPVCWMDVDGSILKLPTLMKLPLSTDFMGVHQKCGPMRNWHVGTMVFDYNPKVIEFLTKWVEESKHGTDEANFENVWVKYAKELWITTTELPSIYYSIPQSNYNSDNFHESVIMHRLSKAPTKKY